MKFIYTHLILYNLRHPLQENIRLAHVQSLHFHQNVIRRLAWSNRRITAHVLILVTRDSVRNIEHLVIFCRRRINESRCLNIVGCIDLIHQSRDAHA